MPKGIGFIRGNLCPICGSYSSDIYPPHRDYRSRPARTKPTISWRVKRKDTPAISNGESSGRKGRTVYSWPSGVLILASPWLRAIRKRSANCWRALIVGKGCQVVMHAAGRGGDARAWGRSRIRRDGRVLATAGTFWYVG